jgi:phosphoglycerate dehydrogenase-like enzyme
MNVLVAIYGDHPWNLPAGHVEYLRRRFSRVTFTHAAGEQELMAHIASADVGFLGRLKAPGLARARRLRWVHSPAAGVGNLMFPEMVASDVIVTTSRGLHGAVIASTSSASRLRSSGSFNRRARATRPSVGEGRPVEIRRCAGGKWGSSACAVGAAVADAAAAMECASRPPDAAPAPRPPSVEVVIRQRSCRNCSRVGCRGARRPARARRAT